MGWEGSRPRTLVGKGLASLAVTVGRVTVAFTEEQGQARGSGDHALPGHFVQPPASAQAGYSGTPPPWLPEFPQ